MHQLSIGAPSRWSRLGVQTFQPHFDPQLQHCSCSSSSAQFVISMSISAILGMLSRCAVSQQQLSFLFYKRIYGGRWRRQHKTDLDGDKWSVVVYIPLGATKHQVKYEVNVLSLSSGRHLPASWINVMPQRMLHIQPTMMTNVASCSSPTTTLIANARALVLTRVDVPLQNTLKADTSVPVHQSPNQPNTSLFVAQRGYLPIPRATWGNFGETRGGMGERWRAAAQKFISVNIVIWQTLRYSRCLGHHPPPPKKKMFGIFLRNCAFWCVLVRNCSVNQELSQALY